MQRDLAGQLKPRGRPDGDGAAGIETVAFLLLEEFSVMSFASAIEPLRMLNRLTGTEAYRWRLCGLDAGSVKASSGIAFPVARLADAMHAADALVVCGGVRIRPPQERRHLSALREAARRGIAIGALSTAPWLLARAGLLEGRRCTIHWENRAAFMETFPGPVCTTALYEIDRGRMTCSGGTAAMDMMLHLVALRFGAALAEAVASQFHHDRIRDSRDQQPGGRAARLAYLPARLRQALEVMQANIAEPLSVAEISRRVGLSARHLERLCLARLSATPARLYLELRLERARELLRFSDRPVMDVAVAAGFRSASHFARRFRALYGIAPSGLRGPERAA